MILEFNGICDEIMIRGLRMKDKWMEIILKTCFIKKINEKWRSSMNKYEGPMALEREWWKVEEDMRNEG